MVEPNNTTRMDMTPQLSWGRLIILCMVAMLLSVFGPLSIFAPMPIAMAFLFYGRPKTFVAVGGVLTLLVTSALVFKGFKDSWVIATIYGTSLVYGLLVSEIIFKKMEPTKGLVKFGMGFVGTLAIGLAVFILISGFDIREYFYQQVGNFFAAIRNSEGYPEMVAKGGEEARAMQEMLSDPKALVDGALPWIPCTIFASIFFALWVNLVMVLRNGPVWKQMVEYPYSLKSLVRFKVPDIFVYGLIIGLVFPFGGEYVIGKMGPVIGWNILTCLGVFYFFQGVGIYLDLLSHLRVYGFFRTILVIFGIFFGWRLIVVVGVFDMWVNFRRFFKNKDNNDEGDIL